MLITNAKNVIVFYLKKKKKCHVPLGESLKVNVYPKT